MWSCPSSWLLLGLMDHPGREEEDHTSSHLGTQPSLTQSQTRLPQNTSEGLRTHLGSYPPRYKTKDQPKHLSKDSLEHIQGPQNTSRDLHHQPPRNTSKDQSKHQTRIPWNTSRDLLLGPRPRTLVIHWGPSLGSFSMAQTTWSQTKNPRSVLGALDLSQGLMPSSRRMALAVA